MVCLALAGLISLRQFPWLPLSVFLLFVPFAALILRRVLFRKNSSQSASVAIGISFAISSIVTIVLWLMWLTGVWGVSDHHCPPDGPPCADDNHWTTNRVSDGDEESPAALRLPAPPPPPRAPPRAPPPPPNLIP